MKKTTIVFLLLTGWISFHCPASLLAENRVALVIGNGDYHTAPLANPVNDARDMAAALEQSGFTVLSEINADRKEMRGALRDFGKMILKGGVGLFYFAGHGIQVKGENYLVPIGADMEAEDEVQDECINASAVLRKMETAGNRLNIIILDACRNNPFSRNFRSAVRGLAQMDAPAGSILGYATAPGAVAADGAGRNGLYTSKILEYMKQPGLEIGQLFRKVRVDVMAASNDAQVPWESSSLTGNFFFHLPSDVPAKAKTAVEKDPKKQVFKEPAGKDPHRKEPYGKTEPFRSKPEPQTFQISADNIASPAGNNRWNWTIFIRADEQTLGQINCVEYTLHPTFPNPVRTVCSRGQGYPFALSSNGWGTFTIRIRVFMASGEIIPLEHYLRF